MKNNLQTQKTPSFLAGALILRGMLLILLLTTISSWSFGQSSQLETDKGIAAAIAPYSPDIRQAILQASQYPEILSNLQQRQNQTQTTFLQMISGFRQKKEGWVYTITRYPDLMHTLATLPDGQSNEAVNQLLPNQDPELQEAAWKLYKHEKNDLIKLDNMKMAAQADFEKSIQNLDANSKAAFQKLSALPDVLTLLTNNIALTTKLGNMYSANPAQLQDQLVALHDSLNVQNQYEIGAFKKQLESDPQAMQEMTQAAKDYANANGLNLPNQPYNSAYNASYYANPYSYWFGYPTWYSSPIWYPGAFGFNSGFYFGLGGFGLYGFPSYGFSNWFFNTGYYYRYPHLYRQFGDYYRSNITGHRIIGSANGGFMGVAHNHFNPNGGRNLNYLTTPSAYRRPSGSYQAGANNTHTSASTYHGQSWGSMNSNRGSYSAGGFRGGGGFSGGGRGGRH